MKLYATLRIFAPEGNEIGEVFSIEFNGSSIIDLLRELKIVEEKARIVFVNGVQVTDLNYELNENDLIVVFPPVGGG